MLVVQGSMICIGNQHVDGRRKKSTNIRNTDEAV